jgi:hypothetical protein
MKKCYSAVFIFLLLNASCLREKIDRGTADISKSWELVKKEVNGNNETDNFKATHNDYVLVFTDAGAFSEKYTDAFGTAQSIAGTWIFQNNVKELKLEDNIQTRFFDIIELNGATLTLQTLNSLEEEIFYFEPY